MDLGQTIVIILAVVLGVWFAIASVYNRRRGLRTYQWVQSGAKTLGTISEASWIGSSGSGARLAVAKPAKPFRRVEIAFLLETREMPPLWLFNRIRGRRDYMIFKADLRRAPKGDVEILPQGDGRFRSLESPAGKESWAMAEGALPGGFAAAQRGRETAVLIESAAPLLESDGASIRRLSIARTSPHVIAEINLPLLTSAPAQDFFKRLTSTLAAGAEEGAPVD